MIKAIKLALLFGFSFSAVAWADGKNFTLTIDGQTYDVAPGDTITAKLKSGAELPIAFARKELAHFDKDGLSFDYPGSINVGEKKFGEGAVQYGMVMPSGTIMIVQRYHDVDDDGLVKSIFDSMSSDDKAAGAKFEVKDATRKLQDGTVLKGIEATTSAGGEQMHYIVMSQNMGQGCMMAATRIKTHNEADDKPIIDKFWSTLKLKN